MPLQDEIDRARGEIRTDGYSVSIGEWVSIYEKRELDIHPEFQRFFRWSEVQKSRLIESILLGIPIPQIFVAQRADGVWDVVDGLQRLSTIYEFMGILRSEDGNVLPPLILSGAKYLPSLAGMQWDNPNAPDKSFTSAQKLLIKRAKIDVSIILKESDDTAKFELFQRLNTGGSQLSDQEVRNAIIVMVNPDAYRWLRRLSDDENFQECVALSERARDEQYDMELVLRFIVFRTMPVESLVNLGDIGDFLTDKAAAMARNRAFDYRAEEDAFRQTFAMLKQTLSSDSFRRYDAGRARFVGGFSVSAYEVVALGVGYNARRLGRDPSVIAERVQRIWSDRAFLDNSGSGIRGSSRIPRILPYGRQLFGA